MKENEKEGIIAAAGCLGAVGRYVDEQIGVLALGLQSLERKLEKLSPEAAAQCADSIEGMKQTNLRLMRLSSHLTDWQRLNLSGFALTDTNICELTRTVCAEAAAEAERRPVRIYCGIRSEETVIIALSQVYYKKLLLNLLSNAVKSSADNGLVTVGMTSDGQWVNITVQDSGGGIAKPEEDARRGPGGSKGIGLGLHIAEAVAVLHGGTLKIENSGGGVMAVVSLPHRRSTNVTLDFNAPTVQSGTFSTVSVELSDVLPAVRKGNK